MPTQDKPKAGAHTQGNGIMELTHGFPEPEFVYAYANTGPLLVAVVLSEAGHPCTQDEAERIAAKIPFLATQSQPKAGFDNQKRWGNSAIEGQGVNSPAMMEARAKAGEPPTQAHTPGPWEPTPLPWEAARLHAETKAQRDELAAMLWELIEVESRYGSHEATDRARIEAHKKARAAIARAEGGAKP